MDAVIEFLNRAGATWNAHAWPMTVQSGVLVLVLMLADRLLAGRVRASVRHAMWGLVPVKLLLPVSLALPTSPAWWVREGLATGRVSAVETGTWTVRQAGPRRSAGPMNHRWTGAEALEATRSFARLDRDGAFLLVWLAGGIGFGGLVLARMRRVSGVLARAGAPSPELQGMLNRLAGELGLRRVPRLAMSDEAGGPAVCGLGRPTILLPPSVADRLDATQLEHVLLHELAHVKRGDLAWSHLGSALLVVYWPNPLLWMADARIRRVREEATDEAVAVARREQVVDYAETLLGVARLSVGRVPALLGLVGILESGSQLGRRVRRLLTGTVPSSGRVGWRAGLGILLFGLVAVPLGRGRAADARPEPAVARTPPSAPAGSEPGAPAGSGDVYTVRREARPEAGRGPLVSPGVSLDLTARERADAQAELGPGLPPGAGVVTAVAYTFRVQADVPAEGEKYQRWMEQFRTALAEAAAQRPAASSNEAVILQMDPRVPFKVAAAAVGAARSAGFRRVQVTGVELSEVPQGEAAVPDESPDPAGLRTRTYRLDSRHLAQELTAVGHPEPEGQGLSERLLKFLGAAGFPRGASNAVFFNEKNGMLLVRAPWADIEVLEQALEVLSAQVPAQYQVEAKFVVVPPGLTLPAGRVAFRNDRESAQVLTAAQRQEVLDTLERGPQPVEVVASPRVTTLDGRQAQIGFLIPGEQRGGLPGMGLYLDVLPVRLASKERVRLLVGVTARWPDPAAAPAPGEKPGSYLEGSSTWENYELEPGNTVLVRVGIRRVRMEPSGLVALEGLAAEEARDLVALVTLQRIDPAGNVIW